MRLRVLAIAAMLFQLAPDVCPQATESLQTILDRGYVRHWLVAGPFAADAEGGIAAAIQDGRPRLGETDFLSPIGGIQRARPQDGLSVKNPDGAKAVFQVLSTTEAGLGLSALLGDRAEAVGYAAFYAVADRPQTVLLEIESTLGVRVALNGAIVKDIGNTPIQDIRTDWLSFPMRSGANLFVFELPGLTLDAAASAASLDPARLTSAIRKSRPMLSGAVGFELGVRAHPAVDAGGLFVIPELEPTGAFTGSATEPRKEVALRVFNSDTQSSQPVTATVTRLSEALTLQRTLSAVAPGRMESLIFEIPTGTAAAGEMETVNVQVVHGSAGIQFRTGLIAEPPPLAGVVAYVLRPAARGVNEYLSAYRGNALLTESGSEFGFHLGPAYLWRAGWARFPEVREPVSQGVLTGSIAPECGYAVPDARFSDLDLFVRNLQIGRAMSESFFASWPPVYYAWDQPALPWRIADVFTAAGGFGGVDNLGYPARDAFELLAGPGGGSLPIRHKSGVTNVVSKPGLRDAARLQRAESAEVGLRTDILVGQYAGLPDPFWAEDISLERSVPSVEVAGDGGHTYFEALSLAEHEGFVPPVAISPSWLALRPGEMVAQPALKSAHAETTALLEQAETFATLAGITGSAFPDSALDAAWRELLWASETDRLGFSASFEVFADGLSAYRRAAARAREVMGQSLGALVRSADTYTHAPSREDGVQALVVFNGASFVRTDLVRCDIAFEQLRGFRLVDDTGANVSYVADEVVVSNQRIARMRFSFVARDVPSFGYATYYIIPETRPAVWSDAEGVSIENDIYVLTVDPKLGGAISSLKSKETKVELVTDPVNDVVARADDETAYGGGREIHASGAVARASAVDAVVRKRIGPGAQRIEVRSHFGGGELVRTVTLFQGLEGVFCETRLEGVSDGAGLIGIEFPAPEDYPQAIVGDGLGMRTARVSLDDAPFETDGQHHDGRAWEPANGWMYLGPGDAIRGGQDTGYPLRPVRIVLDDEAFASAAEDLVRAFAAVGVPADLFDVRPRDRGAYTDATRWADLRVSLQMGEVLWIVLGDPQTAALGLPAGESGSIRFWARGAGNMPGPVLALYGGGADVIEKSAGNVADAIAGGALVLEAEQIDGAVELPNTGLAVLWQGSRLVSFDAGRATLFIAHGGEAKGAESAGWGNGTHSTGIDYTLLPVRGDWRTRDVPRYANAVARPLVAHLTDLHLGPTPQRHAFLAVDGEGVLATGLRPSSMKAAAGSRGETHPRDGVVLNVVETAGRSAEATIRFSGIAFEAGLVNAAGTVVTSARTERGAFTIDLAPNGFAMAGFRPSILGTVPSEIEESAVSRLEWARSWEQRVDTLPEGGLPVTIELREPAPGEESAIVLAISNNTSDAAVSGAVRIETSEGWAVSAPEIEYELEPRALQEHTLLLLRGDTAKAGYILATTVVKNTEIADVWPREVHFSAIAEQKGDEVQIRIENTSAVPLIGFVELISTPETWPELGARPGVVPISYPLRINPYETRRMLFTLPNAEYDGPLAAKVSFNGNVEYSAIAFAE